MRRTATALLAATLLLAGAAVSCSSGPSYDDIVKDCTTALKQRAEAEKGKPAECKDVKADDYDALLMSQTIDDLGWTDKDGNFDEGKMLEDAGQP